MVNWCKNDGAQIMLKYKNKITDVRVNNTYLLFSQFTGTFLQVNISLFTDNIRESASNTLKKN